MFNKKSVLIILIIFFLPIVNAELQPAFLDENIHFLGEEINFGLVGIIPDDFNHVNFEIIMPNDYSYREATLDLENLSDYYIIFPFDFIHPQVNVKYIYYNSNNTETLNQEYTLQFTKLPIMENIKYCINTECDKKTFETLDANEITINTQTEIIDENVNFDILVAQEGYVIENALNQRMPYNIDTTPGEYELEITPKYNNKKFETVSLSLTAKKTEEKSQSLGEYMAEIKEQNEENEIMITSETTEISSDDSTSENNNSKNTLLYIGIGILGVIIIAVILFNKKPKTEDKENRRTTRNQRGFLLFVVFLLCLSSIHALSLEEKTREYQNLEITFDKFQELYPKPVIFPIYISNTQPKNTVYYPLSATDIGDFEKITPVLENKTKNMTVSLETVYLAVNHEKMLETARAKGAVILGVEAGCEQVFDWFYKNPITEDTGSFVKRTKENLLKEIIITDEKNGYTDTDKKQINNKIANLKKKSQYKKSTNPMVDYCVSEVLTKKKSILEEPYLIEKKMLLKIEYEEKNQEAITSEETTVTDTIIFLNKNNKDVLEDSFLGSDLSHIALYVDYTKDILKEQNIEFKGIEQKQLFTENKIVDDEKINYYIIPNLGGGQELTIKYTAQLFNMEIADSEYGFYYRFANNSEIGPEPSPVKKGYEFVISDKNLSKIRNKLISNVDIVGKIKLNTGKYELTWNQETINLLAEVNLDSTKYILLDKTIVIEVGDETNGVSLLIDKDYGIISQDSSDITILLEEDKTAYISQTPNNLHLETLKKIFLKTSTHKNIELIRLQLPLLFIFNFKKNAQTITNEDELYLKTYDDLANLINETKLTKIEKNIIFNNLISLTEDFSFQKPGGELYKFRFKTRLVLNYGLVKYIDNPKTIDSINPENLSAAMPYLYDNDYLERKGFVDKSLTELLVLGYLGENYSSKNSKRQIDPAFDNLDAYEYDLKSQIQQMFVALKADYQNWGYYKQLLSYPFYRSGFEQKICSYDKENFPKFSVKDYCYVAYNLNPSTDNWGILYDSDNLNSGFLMQEGGFQNNYVSAYRIILLFEDIESFKNNKLTFNQNQLKTYNKLNVFFNLIELEATRNRGAYGTKNYGTAIILSYKLKEIWNSKTNELKQYDVENNIGKQIDNIINVLTYQATVKLRSTIASDRILRLDAYKNTYETDAHRYEESINPSGGFFDLSDSARFLITGGWFQTLIFKGKENEIKKIESIDREKYNKLLNGACCISQRLGELENTSTYKNWTIAEIKGTYSPYSKSKNLTRKDQIGWATEGVGCIGLTGTSSAECSRDIQSLYNSKEYGKDISIILNDTKEKKSISSYLTPHYNIKLQYNLDIDQSIQLNSTERELKEKVAELKPGTIGSILRFIDAGINPAAIVITVATVGIGHGLATGTGGFFTRIASGFSAKLGASTAGSMASTVSARVLYELGENVVIDGAYGALAFTRPEIAGKHPFLTCIVLGIIVGNFNRPLSNIDNVAKGMTTDIITNAGLKNADNLKVQNAIKNALNTDYSEVTKQLLDLRNGKPVSNSFFRKLPKILSGGVDDLAYTIQRNLASENISVSLDTISDSLLKNKIYINTRHNAVNKLFNLKKIKNSVVIANLASLEDGIGEPNIRSVIEDSGDRFTKTIDDKFCSDIAEDLIKKSGIKVDDAKRIEIKNAIIDVLQKNFKERENLLLKIKNEGLLYSHGGLMTERFEHIKNLSTGNYDIDFRSLKDSLRKYGKISEAQIKEILNDNQIYRGMVSLQADEFGSIVNYVEEVVYQNANGSSLFVDSKRNSLLLNGVNGQFSDTLLQAKNTKKLSEIDDHFIETRGFASAPENGIITGFYIKRPYSNTLAEIIFSGGDSKKLFKQLDDAIKKIHEAGYAHGNLTLNNIFVVDVDGSYKIIIGPSAGYPDFKTNLNLFDSAKQFDLDSIDAMHKRINEDDFGLLFEELNLGTRQLNVNTANIGDIFPFYNSQNEVVFGKVVAQSGNELTLEVSGLLGIPKRTKIDFSNRAPRLDVGTIVKIGEDVGEITNLKLNKQVEVLLSNGAVKYYSVDEVLQAQSLNTFLNKTDSGVFNMLNIGDNITYGSFNKYPDKFVLSSFISEFYPSSGEFLYVDKSDPIIQKFLGNIREMAKSTSDQKTLVKKVYDYVSSTFSTYSDNTTDILSKTKYYDNQILDSKMLPLSFYMTNRMGVCRHNATLVKLALDELDIPSSVRIGGLTYVGSTGGEAHAWVVTKINGEDWLIDPAQQKLTPMNVLSFEDRLYVSYGINQYSWNFYEVPAIMDRTPQGLKNSLDTLTSSATMGYSKPSVWQSVNLDEINSRIQDNILTQSEFKSVAELYEAQGSIIYNNHRSVFRQLNMLEQDIIKNNPVDPGQLKNLKDQIDRGYNCGYACYSFFNNPNSTTLSEIKYAITDIIANKNGLPPFQLVKDGTGNYVLTQTPDFFFNFENYSRNLNN